MNRTTPTFHIGPEPWLPDTVAELLWGKARIALSAEAEARIARCRHYLDEQLQDPDAMHYGINTGFGSLCNVRILGEEITDLQHNLVRSHACGTGPEVPPDIVRLMLLLKIKSLALGYSGVSLELVRTLCHFFNHDLLPIVHEQGSLGASGDLAPLAHLSLPLLGEGDVRLKGKTMPAAEALRACGLHPIDLQSKEGLALLNGTQFSAAYALWALLRGEGLLRQANLNAALAVDAFDCRPEPFMAILHEVRGQEGQMRVAAEIRQWLEGSELLHLSKTQVQDPYAFRCVPQVHGASADALRHTRDIIQREISAVTDNPTIFPEAGLILSGGNFHAQPLALAMDYMAIALAELGSIAERRLYQLIGGQRGLPVFLTQRAGLHSGFMIAQYAAAAIASQNKQLCTPASVDSIVSCNGQEDHVSMAANAGTKLMRVVDNVERLLAIEFMAGAQALAYRRPLHSSPRIEALLRAYREHVPLLREDRVLSEDFQRSADFLRPLQLAGFQ